MQIKRKLIVLLMLLMVVIEASAAQEKKVVSPANAYLRSLTSLPSSFGIIVCEPIVAGNPEKMADFGAGCGRWLQFVVGGQPELGKTPAWDEIRRAASESGIPICA